MDHARHGAAIAQAAAVNAPKPCVSATEAEFSLDDAYAIQRAYVQMRSKSVAVLGFKAAVTATSAQAAFGLTAPASGVLFAPGALVPGARQALGDFNRLVLETEFGYRLNRVVEAPVDDAAQYVGSVHLMIELADAGFEGRQTGLDLIAGNAASSRFIEGPTVAANAPLDATETQLARGDEVLFKGKGSDALGGQMLALRWLINQTVAEGYAITPDHILMTGALGGAAPGAAGEYMARFGELGTIGFELF